MLIGNGFYIFSFAEVQNLHSRFACHILPHEDVKYDVYMQELNVVMLYAVIFGKRPRMSNPKMSNRRMSNPKVSNAKVSNQVLIRAVP